MPKNDDSSIIQRLIDVSFLRVLRELAMPTNDDSSIIGPKVDCHVFFASSLIERIAMPMNDDSSIVRSKVDWYVFFASSLRTRHANVQIHRSLSQRLIGVCFLHVPSIESTRCRSSYDDSSSDGCSNRSAPLSAPSPYPPRFPFSFSFRFPSSYFLRRPRPVLPM